MLPLGSILDRKYDLQEKIGEGAMGTVYRATHVVTQQELAVKVLSARRATETAKARFLREVRLAGALRHPNVVRVVDAGEDQESETLYIVMEHLVGRDLEAVFDRGVLSRAEALEHLLQVLSALAQAHDAGIVHRDLKPENLFLCDDGTVKLLDFGVARDLGGTKVTATGTAMGTPVYMSPEQGLRPKEIDHRSDLWSVGVMLYEMVASFPPFVDDSPHAVVFKANTEAHAPLGEVVPGTPPELVALVDRCLSKSKEGRPADARAIATVLREVLADDRAAAFLATRVAFGTGEVGPSTAPVPLHSSPTAAASGAVGPSTGSVPAHASRPTIAGGQPVASPVGGRPRAWAGLVVLAAVALLGWLGWSLSHPGEDPSPPAVAGPAEASEPTRTDPPEPAPRPVPIQPVVASEPQRPTPRPEPAPRLARRAPSARTAERAPPEPEPLAAMAPAEDVGEAPTSMEPEPRVTPEPRAPEPRRPTTSPVRERPSPSTERTTRRRVTEPRAEPEPPPLTF